MRLGTYKYGLTGWREYERRHEDFPKGSTETLEIFDYEPNESGGDFTFDVKNSIDSVNPTYTLRWTDHGAQMVSVFIIASGQGWNCVYKPMVQVLRLPIETGSLPDQHWSTDRCEGTAEVNVIGREKVHLVGRDWDTWKIETRMNYQYAAEQFDPLRGTLHQTAWFAPELGTSVKVVRSDDAYFGTGRYRTFGTSLLTKYPAWGG